MTVTIAALTVVVSGTIALAIRAGRRRHIHRWLVPYAIQRLRRRRSGPRRSEPREIHLILAIADHFEPEHGGVSRDQAQRRVDHWVSEYPRALGDFRDSDGRPPRHTFFYPLETYQPEHLDALAEFCRAGFGEVEVHLHHEGDTAENLRATLCDYTRRLRERHGLLPRHRRTGRLGFGFVHGDWALDNARPDGRCCGVNNELDVLREAGCYADFTLPSAPSCTQTRTINSLYRATDDPARPRSHETGRAVGDGPPPPGSLMLIQGPLVLDWRRRGWGLFPHVENGCLQASQPPSIDRLDAWLAARVQVPSRPDWYFVKLHAHGAPEFEHPTLLGPPMIEFHRALAGRALGDPRFHYHYVTAREMYNLVRAAESAWTGDVDAARDFEMIWDGHHPQMPGEDGSFPTNSSASSSDRSSFLFRET